MPRLKYYNTTTNEWECISVKGDPGDDYVLTEDDKEEIAEKAAEKIEIPESSGSGIDVTAKPGQMIRVKSVDEKGKPAAWEPVPWGWVEDEVYADGEYVSRLIPYFGVFGIDFSDDVETIPESVSVVFDGVKYNNLNSDEVPGMGTAFGNLYYMNAVIGTSYENTGEPFLVGVSNIGVTLFLADTESTRHTVTITFNETIHPIPGELLPEGVPYVEKGFIFEETDMIEFTHPTFGKSWGYTAKAPTLTVGETYTIIYNGVPYDCVCHPGEDTGVSIANGAFALGNFAAVGGENTGEPFAMLIFPSVPQIALIDLSSATAVKIGIMGEVCHKLDPRCLPDDFSNSGGYVVSDVPPEDTSALWVDPTDNSCDEFQEAVNAALAQAKASGEFDGKDYVLTDDNLNEIAEMAADLVPAPEGGGIVVTGAKVGQTVKISTVDENGKPTAWEAVPWGYTEGGMVEILPETQLVIYDNDSPETYITTPFSLTIGETYIVNLSGAEHQCNCIDGGAYNETYSGMSGLVNEGADLVTGEGLIFGVLCLPEPMQGVYGIVMFANKPTEATISIYQDNTVIHPIPGKFLPEGVPYIEDGITEILPECRPIYDADEGLFQLAENAPPFVVGETYIVNWNGTDYTCVGQDMSVIAPGVVALGDVGQLMGGTSTGEPFVIYSGKKDGVQFLMSLPIDGTTELTLSIKGMVETIHKLDNRCLDLAWLPTIGLTKGEVLVPEQIPNKSGYFNDVNFAALNPDITNLLITVNGVEHLCSATVEELTSVSDGDYIVMQCATPAGPFLMEYRPNNSAETYAYIGIPSGTSPTVSVYIAEQGANRMPEEFLPEGVPYVGHGATVGQTLRISAVDENGVPTAWESVDFPSGGGGTAFKFLASVEPITEPVSLIEVSIEEGVTEIYLRGKWAQDGTSGYPQATIRINGTGTVNSGISATENYFFFNGILIGGGELVISKSTCKLDTSGTSQQLFLMPFPGRNTFGETIKSVGVYHSAGNFAAGTYFEVWGR